ncbi:MAG: hypothetical protein HUU56_03660 [Bdellovibrionaceae bacterium]|nr:hypothetical protein [Pseudobdellovibrionaceae bacterium]
MMKNCFLFIPLLIVNIFIQISCQTKPVKTLELGNKVDISKLPKFYWETKAQIRDLKRKKNNNVSIDFLAIKNAKIRLEIKATLGIQVGTLGISQEQFIAVLYRQKNVIQGKMDEKVLTKAFNLPIPPEALYSIAFDESIKGTQWKCNYDNLKVVSLCENEKQQSRVEWSNRVGGGKLVKIYSPTIEVDWFFKPPQVLEINEETFKVEIPNGYKVTNI